MGPGEFMVCSRWQMEELTVGLFIVILEIFRTQIDSIQIVISRKTDFRIPTKKVIIPSAGVVGVSTGFLSISDNSLLWPSSCGARYSNYHCKITLGLPFPQSERCEWQRH